MCERRYHSKEWADCSALLATLNDANAWNASLTGPGFVLEQILGGLTKSPFGEVTGATVMAFVYPLAGNQSLADAQEVDEAVVGWEREFLAKLQVRNPETACRHPHIGVYYTLMQECMSL